MTTHHGFLLHVDPNKVDMLASLKVTKHWDDHVLTACLLFLEDESVLYDIGANSGYVAIACSALRHDRVHVIAFEPQPTLSQSIVTSKIANQIKNLYVMRAALSDKTRIRELFLARHSIHAWFVPRDHCTGTLKVNTYALDDLVNTYGLPGADVLKVEVEGAEMEVFDGARAFLTSNKPTVIFECDDNVLRFGHMLADVITLFRELGYDRFYHIRSNGQYEALETTHSCSSGDFIATTARRAERAGLESLHDGLNCLLNKSLKAVELACGSS
jgi:FkbM family methyltransferase